METQEKNRGNGKMTIEELAFASEMTVRNIRAHHSRGLLPSPKIEGRKGYYNEVHLERLKEIRSFQERGYSLAAIHDLLIENGLGNLDLGAMAALGAWQEEEPVTIPLAEFFLRFPAFSDDKKLFEHFMATGIYKIEGDKIVVPWPVLLDTTEVLLNSGATMESILDLQTRTLQTLRIITRDVIEFFIADVLGIQKNCGDPERVAETVGDFRATTLASFRAWFSHSMEGEIASMLGDSKTPGEKLVPDFQKTSATDHKRDFGKNR